MQHKNSELMAEIKKNVDEFYSEHGRTPTEREIAASLGIGNSTVHRYLNAMAETGMLNYNGDQIVTSKIAKHLSSFSFAPIVGSIPCGTPNEEEENVEGYVSLPKAIFGPGDCFILRANGDSMIGAGINDGDLVVIRKQENAEPGDIVAALIDDSQSSLKRLCYDKNGVAYLHPENELYEDIYPEAGLRIQGVATRVIKTLCQ